MLGRIRLAGFVSGKVASALIARIATTILTVMVVLIAQAILNLLMDGHFHGLVLAGQCGYAATTIVKFAAPTINAREIVFLLVLETEKKIFWI